MMLAQQINATLKSNTVAYDDPANPELQDKTGTEQTGRQRRCHDGVFVTSDPAGIFYGRYFCMHDRVAILYPPVMPRPK
jgi:hypothetical protein